MAMGAFIPRVAEMTQSPGYLLFSLVLWIHIVDSVGFIPGVDMDNDENVCQNSIDYVGQRTPDKQEKSPFKIQTNMTKYIPGQAMLVTITGSVPIRGFTLHARRLRSQDIVGNFKAPSANSIKAYNCDTTADTLVGWFSAADASKKSSFIWQPPDDNQGSMEFVGTFFQNENKYWKNVKSNSMRKGFANIDVSTCGVEKGCFRYATGEQEECTHDTCEYIVTHRREGDNAHFEMSGLASWVAIGFSSDDKMGGDDVFMCVNAGNGVQVQRYFTKMPHVTPTLQSENPLFNHQVDDVINGRISCSFSRPLKVVNDQSSVDLENDWYQLYAWGPVASSGTIMRHTLERPPTSDYKTILSNSNNVLSGSGGLAVGHMHLFISAVTAIVIAQISSSNHFT